MKKFSRAWTDCDSSSAGIYRAQLSEISDRMKEPQVHVFVLKSGAVELRTLEGTYNNYRVPRRPPTAVTVCVDAVQPPTILYDEYRQRGRMFNGRPILCASGYDVKEATATLIVIDHPRDIEGADGQLRREIQRLIDREYWCATTVLEEWTGDDPWLDDERRHELRAQHLRQRRRRVLLATPAPPVSGLRGDPVPGIVAPDGPRA